MNKICLLIAIIIFVLINTSATVSAENWYIGGDIAAVFLYESDIDNGFSGLAEFENGYGFAGVVGRNFNSWRIEGEIAYRKNDYDKVGIKGGQKVSVDGSFKSLGFLANGYYDFKIQEPFVPFVMIGIGGAKLNTDAVSGGGVSIPDDDVWQFAYQFGIGIGWQVTKSLTLDLSYRFYATLDPKFNGIEMEYQTNNILLGVRYNF